MTTSTLRAVVILIVATVSAIVLLSLFREGDNTAIILQIVGIVAPTTVALMAYLQSSKNNDTIASVKQDVQQNTSLTEGAQGELRELKITVDGRLSQLIAAKQEASDALVVAAGLQGAQDERDRQPTAIAVAMGTPAHGTIISPGGPTTIAPDGPVTVVLPADVKIVKDGTS